MSLDRFAATYLPMLDAHLAELLRQGREPVAAFYGMMQYHLGWVDAQMQPARSHPGKRLRPLLCLLSCRAAGGEPEDALPAASALELVHSFSLVHDDIEDGSRLRRGRPTVWDVWGQPQALNVGDALFALARLAILRLAGTGVPAERTLAAAQALDRACLALCEGQYLDMCFETLAEVSLDQYLEMIRLKTGTLLAASAQIGALVAVEDTVLVEQIYRFGMNTGIAFQIQDDVLGIWGDEVVTGKPASTDLRDKKKTLPVVHALSGGVRPAEAARLAQLLRQAGPLEGDEYSEALEILERAGSRAYAEGQAGHYLESALAELEGMALREPDERALEGFAGALAGRRR